MSGGRLQPETDRELTASFELRDRAGVVRELRRMVGRGSEVALVDVAGQVVEARPTALEAAALVLSVDPAHADSPVLSAPSLTLVSLVDDVKVQGEVRGPLRPDASGRVRVAIPDRMVRLQRRDGFRVRIPESEPSFLFTNHAKYAVLDVSVAGVGLEPTGEAPLRGERWPHCRLRLGMLVLPVDLIVRHVHLDRLGCAFDAPGGAVQRQLGRHVMELERMWMRAR